MKHWVTWTIGFFGLCKIQHLFKWPNEKNNWMLRFSQTTIDGSEIQRSPVDVGSLSHVFSHYLQGFSCIQTVETAKVGISEAKKIGQWSVGHRLPRWSASVASRQPRGPFQIMKDLMSDLGWQWSSHCHCTLQGMDTYPTLGGKGKSSSKCHFWGIC